MLKTLEEIKQVELSTSGVINGVDNANLLSVDSTTPIVTDADKIEKEEEEKEEEKKNVEKTPIKPETEIETKVDKPEESVSKPEVKDKIEKRIGDLTKKWRSTERERDFERTKRLEAEAELKKLKAAIPQTAKPKKEDFEDEAEFYEALTDWKVENKLKVNKLEDDKKTELDAEHDAVQVVEQVINEVVEKGRDTFEDFDEIVYSKDLDITQPMVEVIILSDIAEHVLYYLGKNPDEAAAISKMSTLKIAKEIGKIEVKVAAEIPKLNVSTEGGVETPEIIPEVKPVTVPKKTTKTPDPITPVKVTGAIEKDPSQMTPKEYRTWREAGNR